MLARFALPALLIATACAVPAESNVDAKSATGDASIQGLVLGYTPTADGGWTTEPVGSTKVEYATFLLPGFGGDSAGTVGPWLGSVTADAQGRFTINAITAGWYALRFTPPAESPYAGGVRKINSEEYSGQVATFSLLLR